MSLQVWLPLNGNIQNNGLCNTIITTNNITYNDNGKIGKCAYFNGSDSYISLSSQAINDCFKGSNQAVTVAFWIKHADTNRALLFGDYGLTGGINFNIELPASSTPYLRWYWGGTPDQTIGTNVCPPDSTWHHCIIIYTGTKLKVYKDGILNAEVDLTLASKTKTNGTWYIGRDNRTGVTAFQGYLNDFRVYNHALTDSEIQEIYNTKVFHYQLNNLKTGIGNHHITFLPTEYQEVQYLESIGTAWIGNIPIEANDEIQIVTEATNNTNSEQSILGASGGPFEFYFKNGRINCWNHSVFISPYDNRICSAFNIISTRFKVTVTCSAYMFGYNGTSYNLIGRIYSLKIYSSEKHLKYKFIPCYRISDHKPGMYETVNGVFYVNGSSGADFIYGPLIKNIPTGYQPLEYLQNDGTAYINTDIPCRNTLEWECDFCWDQNINNGCCIGGRNGDNRRYVAWFNNVYIYGWNNGYQALSVAPVVGKWDKIKCSWAASGTKFYLNNTLIHSSNVANPDSTSTSATIGIFGTGQGGQKTKGKIKYAILRISNIIERDLRPALRESDGIAGMYDLVNDVFYTNAASSGSFAYPGCQENVQYNGQGYIYTGTFHGTESQPATSSRYASSLWFNRITSNNAIKYKPFLLGNNWTLSIWLYPRSGVSGWQALAIINTSGGDNDLKAGMYYHNSENRIQFSANGNYTSNTQYSEKDKWVHFVETYNGSVLKGYINGIESSSSNISAAELSRPNLVIGGKSNDAEATNISYYWTSKLSDFRIYATCLSADEVLKLYKMGHVA